MRYSLHRTPGQVLWTWWAMWAQGRPSRVVNDVGREHTLGRLLPGGLHDVNNNELYIHDEEG